jgi:hypothetical protein
VFGGRTEAVEVLVLGGWEGILEVSRLDVDLDGVGRRRGRGRSMWREGDWEQSEVGNKAERGDGEMVVATEGRRLRLGWLNCTSNLSSLNTCHALGGGDRFEAPAFFLRRKRKRVLPGGGAIDR